jgi:hypothetical protein
LNVAVLEFLPLPSYFRRSGKSVPVIFLPGDHTVPLLPSYRSENRSVRFTVRTHAIEIVVEGIPALA